MQNIIVVTALLQIYFLTFKTHIGINSVLLSKKHKWLVNIAQEYRFNDLFAINSILLTFESFLMLLRHSATVS